MTGLAFIRMGLSNNKPRLQLHLLVTNAHVSYLIFLVYFGVGIEYERQFEDFDGDKSHDWKHDSERNRP